MSSKPNLMYYNVYYPIKFSLNDFPKKIIKELLNYVES